MGRVMEVLLTGYPSLRADYVLRELLARDAHVHILLRAEDRAALEAHPEVAARVSVVEGEVGAMDLGLSGEEFRGLAERLTHIHHAAISEGSELDDRSAEALHVAGTREVLELAEACTHLQLLTAHSSIGVFGGREGVVSEDDAAPMSGHRNAVEATLARAERMLREAMPRAPIAVVRSGMIVGDSKTGVIDRLDGFYLLVLLLMSSPRDFALPLPSRGDAPLYLTPIDYVAKAACHIAEDPRAAGKTFHLVERAPLPSRRVIELVAQATGRRMGRGFIPANVTKALLSAPGIDRLARSPRTLLDALVTRVSFGTENADAVLGAAGVACPTFESYVDVLVEHTRRHLDERRERRAATVDYDPLV